MKINKLNQASKSLPHYKIYRHILHLLKQPFSCKVFKFKFFIEILNNDENLRTRKESKNHPTSRDSNPKSFLARNSGLHLG